MYEHFASLLIPCLSHFLKRVLLNDRFIALALVYLDNLAMVEPPMNGSQNALKPWSLLMKILLENVLYRLRVGAHTPPQSLILFLVY